MSFKGFLWVHYFAKFHLYFNFMRFHLKIKKLIHYIINHIFEFLYLLVRIKVEFKSIF